MAEESATILKVAAADEMNDATFIKHFNMRHADQLGGLRELLPTINDSTVAMYRDFHDMIHRWYLLEQMEYPHDHK